MREEEPLIGIVIPLFKHSALVAEALHSLTAQHDAPPFVVALVNDGCPYIESELTGAAFFSSSKLKLHHIKRVNGGLSAARNSGVDFLLSSYEDLQAIYFLDADNRLKPYALRSMARALDLHPNADWYYPDIEMFGLSSASRYSGNYSHLLHLMSNICEAGSLVRRRVFLVGQRFDEHMRHGFEDWDFWLGAAGQGFRGQHIPHLGLEYRKRPDSMLANSNRLEAEIKTYMRGKRKSSSHLHKLLIEECDHAPRYAIVCDPDTVYLCTDFNSPVKLISLMSYVEEFWRWVLRPNVHAVPPFLVFASKDCLAQLQDFKIIRWCLWDLEVRLFGYSSSSIQLATSARRSLEIKDRYTQTDPSTDCSILMFSVEYLREICRRPDRHNPVFNMVSGRNREASSARTLLVPGNSRTLGSAGHPVAQAALTVSLLRTSEYARALKVDWMGASGVPERHLAFKAVRTAVTGGVAYPIRPDGRQHIGLLSSAESQAVALQAAERLIADGYVPHVISFEAAQEWSECKMVCVESVLFASVPNVSSETLFDGTPLVQPVHRGEKIEFLGMSAWLDCVINFDVDAAHAVMGELREAGVITIAYQADCRSRANIDSWQASALLKAYEHSYDRVVCGSLAVKDWLISQGLPRAKLTEPNGAMIREGRSGESSSDLLNGAKSEVDQLVDVVKALGR